ncbi:hypothetical protein Tco_0286053 [Tanacetum coccineum]
MLIDSNKPPDPLFDEFCELTKMTSAEEICNASFNDTKVKVVKGKHHKPFRGIKISTPGSAGAGLILRLLCSTKVSGKARDRVEGSAVDSRGGKRVSSSPLNNEIKEVLADLNLGKLNNNLKFSMGYSSDVLHSVCSLNSEVEANNVSNGNNGSFIEAPLNPSPCSDRENSPVAKSCGLKTSLDSTSMGDVGSIMCGLASSKDGITIAQTGFLNEKGMAGPSFMSNLASMDDVVSAGIGSHSPMDGISCDKDGDKFEFGKISGSKVVAEKFAKKLKKGSEEMALKMEYVPSAVSKLENGNRRIMFIVEELCNGNDIGKIMSGVGKPMLMDKMTKEQCLKKARKLDFARVLVEVSANDELPNVLEMAYLPIRNREARVGKLGVRYQWKPPLCTHCKTFGHTSLACKLRPITDVERVAKIVKDASNLKGPLEENCNVMGSDEDGFVQVGKNNKPILNPAKVSLSKNIKGGQSRSDQSSGFLRPSQKQDTNQGKSSLGYGKYGNHQRYSYEKQGNFQSNNRGNVGSKWKSNQAGSAYFKKYVVQSTSISSTSKDNRNDGNKKRTQNLRQLSKDLNFKPKVLVRGSSSKINSSGDCNEPIPTMYSFLVLVDDFMVGDDSDINKDKSHVEDFESIWPNLKSEVDILMEAGIYPSKSVRLDWTVNQIDYFYKNCHKYHLDPSYEDEDVKYECDGVAMSMRLEFEMDAATDMENDAAQVKNVFNASICSRVLGRWEWASNNASSNGGTRIIVGWDPNCANVMIIEQSAQAIHCFVEPLNVTTAMSDFRDCVAEIEVDDISMSGLNFTWNKSPGKVGGLLKKLDRVMAVFAIPEVAKAKPKPFKFHNYLTGKDGFIPAIKKVWDSKVNGNLPLFNLLWLLTLFSSDLREAELLCLKAFKEALKDEELFLRQKSKIEWFSEGDCNSKYFHNVVKGRINRGRIFGGRHVLPFNNPDLLFTNKLSEGGAVYMIRDISDNEIKAALFDIDNNKAPGPDSKLLKEVNSTVISLVPKISTPRRVSDYRPIACFNVVYKCIKLLRGYHRKRGYARCTFKVDIQKAYYSVEWSFLRDCLTRFGFHSTMIKWIMECITSMSFSINVNGDLRGFIKGKRGLRQGDPLSPYLFTRAMESVSVLKNSLDEFGSVSGLFPSFPRSTMFFGNVRETCRTKILKVMSFIEGKLPVRYLGVPLLSKRLYVNDCSVLVDKVKKKILNWTNKLLSFAGRLQLIPLVVGSMQVYWSFMFILPITISNEVERLMRDFLWNYGDFKRGKARIKWADVYKPKVEGGLEKEGSSWSWKKILRYIGVLRSHIVHRIGNGLDTSLWFDNCHAICPS